MTLHAAVPYLRVRNMTESLRFYRECLGFEVAGAAEADDGPYFARLERDGVALMLSDRPSRFLDFRDHGEGHFHEHGEDEGAHFHGIDSVHDGALNFVIYVYVDDLDAAYEELTSKGVEAVEPPLERFYGQREFLIRDPDGYYFAFAPRSA
ncbi:MAG TPA: VOC family protein [Dehalococcoidia bacterium]|nr:VOC family protein [Dehalococcoidia bacterium]